MPRRTGRSCAAACGGSPRWWSMRARHRYGRDRSIAHVRCRTGDEVRKADREPLSPLRRSASSGRLEGREHGALAQGAGAASDAARPRDPRPLGGRDLPVGLCSRVEARLRPVDNGASRRRVAPWCRSPRLSWAIGRRRCGTEPRSLAGVVQAQAAVAASRVPAAGWRPRRTRTCACSGSARSPRPGSPQTAGSVTPGSGGCAGLADERLSDADDPLRIAPMVPSFNRGATPCGGPA